MADLNHTITQERLKELLHYDPLTGLFTRLVCRGSEPIGAIAGTTCHTGDIHITVDSVAYNAHRLAWLYAHGQWPQSRIGHRNGLNGDNRLDNLFDFADEPKPVRRPRDALTAERVRELFAYDPETGVFTRKPGRKVANVGGTVGTPNANGYLITKIDARTYLMHRLAWLYVHGEWPKHFIDHANGICHDNRICNLRDVTNAENTQNQRGPGKANTSGYLGVRARAACGKWQADIQVNGKPTYIGFFDTPEAAHAAYLEAKRRLHSTCTI